MPQHVTSLVRTSVKTANYTASSGDLVPVDTTSGNVTITLPTAPPSGNRVAVKHVTQGGANKVTVQCGGSDVFNKTGGVTSALLTVLNQAITVQYDSGIWTVVSDDVPLAALNAAYMGIGGAAVTQPVTLTDTAGFGNNILDIEHAANGTGGNAGQTYGINIHNAVGAVSAVVVHQYSQQGDPAIWVDNCGTAPILKLHNTQNLVTAPGQDGTGDFIQLFDHGTATLTWSKDHVLTVSNNKTFTIIGSGTTSKVMSLQTVQDITALEIVKANANGAEVVRIDNQGFGNSVRIQNNGTVNFLIDYQGLIRWVAAGNQQTTVGAAGGASALPATPTKYLKVLDSAGTTLVIPAYAAA